jgi:hypothetical protein
VRINQRAEHKAHVLSIQLPLIHGVCRILFIKEYNVIVGIIYIELVPVTIYISMIVTVHREV